MSWGKRKDGQAYKKTNSSGTGKAGTTNASGTIIKKTIVVNYTEGLKYEKENPRKRKRAKEGAEFDLPSGARGIYIRDKYTKELDFAYLGEGSKEKDIEFLMYSMKKHKEIRKHVSFTKQEALEFTKGLNKHMMFYVDPEDENWFPITSLVFNDTQVKGIWLMGYYNDRHGHQFSAFIIKDDKHWNELIDEGRFASIDIDGKINNDFKTRDRSEDRKNDTY